VAKRRTSGIQRRSRASDEALTRRLGAGGGPTLDWRVLLIGSILVLGLVVLLLVFLFGGGGGGGGNGDGIGTPQVNDGDRHIADGTQGGPYSSVPATSGPHWSSASAPGPWGVYSAAQPQEALIHNLEHGGIVIWYQPGKLDADGIAALTTYVQSQISTELFKVILSPWGGADFGHPIAVTAWTWLLYLDTADIDSVRTFVDAHYNDAPEPFGGPGQPGT
jgi:hypothetical protein